MRYQGLPLRNAKLPSQVPLAHWTCSFHLSWQPAPWAQSPKPFSDQECQPRILANSLSGRGRGNRDMVPILPPQLTSSTQCDVTEHRTGERRAQLVLEEERATAHHSPSPCFTCTLILSEPTLPLALPECQSCTQHSTKSCGGEQRGTKD